MSTIPVEPASTPAAGAAVVVATNLEEVRHPLVRPGECLTPAVRT